MLPIAHPGRLLKRELEARNLSANRVALALGVPSGRITDILNGRRSITAETAVRLGRYFGNRPPFLARTPEPIRHCPGRTRPGSGNSQAGAARRCLISAPATEAKDRQTGMTLH